MKRKKAGKAGAILLIISILMIVIGGITFVRALGPSAGPINSKKTLILKDGKTKEVTLKEGEYSVWVKENTVERVNLSVQDEEGNSVYEEPYYHQMQSIVIMDTTYSKIGSLSLDDKGEYTFQADVDCELYIHEPYEDMAGMLIGGLLFLFGILWIMIGIILTKKGMVDVESIEG